MMPLNLVELLGSTGANMVYFAIGLAFGFILESAGFGDSRKLAAQFYFKDLAVLQVMFTAIVTAMILVFWAVALGWLDYDAIWVNPTYLWPGIAGGLIMGVGFIIGGFCPGTSLVSLATLKVDGAFFVAGVFAGIFAFGETVETFTDFYNSSFYGRLTLMDVFGLSNGVMVLLVVLMAIGMFAGASFVRDRLAVPREEKRS